MLLLPPPLLLLLVLPLPLPASVITAAFSAAAGRLLAAPPSAAPAAAATAAALPAGSCHAGSGAPGPSVCRALMPAFDSSSWHHLNSGMASATEVWQQQQPGVRPEQQGHRSVAQQQ